MYPSQTDLQFQAFMDNKYHKSHSLKMKKNIILHFEQDGFCGNLLSGENQRENKALWHNKLRVPQLPWT